MTNRNAVDADRDGGEPDRTRHQSDGPEPSGSAAPDGADTDDTVGTELPSDVVDEIERLTRLKRTAVDESETDAYHVRRDELLSDHDFTARIRNDEGNDVLVLHPADWHAEGVIRTDRIDDIDRAVEIPLEGAGDPDDWDDINSHNRDLVETVRDDHGEIHGDNASTLADFASNHYAKQIESLTSDELTEFRTEYFVRNAWPTENQRTVIEESIALVFETADQPIPKQYR